MGIFGKAKLEGAKIKGRLKSTFYKIAFVLILIPNVRHALLFDYNNIALRCV